jgi:hypothetical protein
MLFRRSLQLQLMCLYCEVEEWKSALKLGTAILPELKKYVSAVRKSLRKKQLIIKS